MEITYRPMEAQEAWDFIENHHHSYHSHLKRFGYRYDMFIPDHPAIREMYDQPILTQEQIAAYRDVFLKQIYNKETLQKLDAVLKNEALPALENVVNVLSPIAENWGIIFPDKVEIITTYGCGGSYNWGTNPAVIFRMERFDGTKTIGLLQHEFVHVLIEEPIIQRYNVPQDLKERIVDVICLEYFGRPCQKAFENSFANAYISKETIEKNLPDAVQRMMTDYNLLQAKKIITTSL